MICSDFIETTPSKNETISSKMKRSSGTPNLVDFPRFFFYLFTPSLSNANVPTAFPFFSFCFFIFLKMLSTSTISRSLRHLERHVTRRFYGLPASAIHLGTDPRKDKTVQLTPYRGVNIIHDPLLSKGKQNNSRQLLFVAKQLFFFFFRHCFQSCRKRTSFHSWFSSSSLSRNG